MATLIEVRDADGAVRGRCGKGCYDAKHKRCTCPCLGHNHGVGREKAIENTRERAEKEGWAAEYARQMSLEEYEVAIGNTVAQSDLLDVLATLPVGKSK
jgi:hypothetical protein